MELIEMKQMKVATPSRAAKRAIPRSAEIIFAIALALFGTQGCSTQPTESTDAHASHGNLQDSSAVLPFDDERKDREVVMSASASTWPRSMSDFKFPFRGVEYACSELWKIVCGYGCYKHVNVNYPAAGFYSVDLVRVGVASRGSCVLAAARGKVVFSGWMTGYGWCVVMDHDDGNTGLKYKSIVAHLLSDPNQFVRVGDDLLQGTVLGYCGNSGGDYIDHIHFGIWKNNVSVPINGISGYYNLVVGDAYYSFNPWFQPPRSVCACR